MAHSRIREKTVHDYNMQRMRRLFIVIVGTSVATLLLIFLATTMYRNNIVVLGPAVGEYTVKISPTMPEHKCDPEKAVFVMNGGYTSICEADVVSVVVEETFTGHKVEGVNLEYSGHTVSHYPQGVQPGPRFRELLGDKLPAGFNITTWPAPFVNEDDTDILVVMRDGELVSVPVHHSDSEDRAFIWPTIEGIHGEVVVWDIGEYVELVASEWDPVAIFGNGWEEEMLRSDLPATRSHSSYPATHVAVFGGWTITLTLDNEMFDVTLGGTKNVSVRNYISPWGNYYTTFITFDGGSTWVEWPEGTREMVLDGKGWSITIMID